MRAAISSSGSFWPPDCDEFSAMKATDVLKEQHHEVEDLFKKLQKADIQEKRHVFDEIAQNLVAHDAIERQIFYPACQKHMAGALRDTLGQVLNGPLITHPGGDGASRRVSVSVSHRT